MAVFASRKPSALVLSLGAITAVALLVAAVATYFAHRFYVERARARLTPTFEARFASQNGQLAPPVADRVVMIGDSRVADWESQPPAPGAEVVWRGIRGETTAQLLHRFSADTHGIGASVVVIQAGINDLVMGIALGQDRSAADVAYRNLQAMVKSSTESGASVILLTVIPPASPPLWRRLVWSESIYPLVADFNRRLHALSGPRVQILEADRIVCGGSDRVPGRLARDTLHLLPPAYDMLNQELREELRKSMRAVQ